MTRINVVPPEELSRLHLLAEIRELPRVFTLVKKAQARGVNKYNFHQKYNQPKNYTLGTGHVIFFYDKLNFLLDRYLDLCREWRKRGYNIVSVREEDLSSGLERHWFKYYTPSPEALQINRQRIQERTK